MNCTCCDAESTSMFLVFQEDSNSNSKNVCWECADMMIDTLRDRRQAEKNDKTFIENENRRLQAVKEGKLGYVATERNDDPQLLKGEALDRVGAIMGVHRHVEPDEQYRSRISGYGKNFYNSPPKPSTEDLFAAYNQAMASMNKLVEDFQKSYLQMSMQNKVYETLGNSKIPYTDSGFKMMEASIKSQEQIYSEWGFGKHENLVQSTIRDMKLDENGDFSFATDFGFGKHVAGVVKVEAGEELRPGVATFLAPSGMAYQSTRYNVQNIPREVVDKATAERMAKVETRGSISCGYEVDTIIIDDLKPVCRCEMRNLMSTGHDDGCPEKKT